MKGNTQGGFVTKQFVTYWESAVGTIKMRMKIEVKGTAAVTFVKAG